MATKPKRSDFGAGRQGAARYQQAMRTWSSSQRSATTTKNTAPGTGRSRARRQSTTSRTSTATKPTTRTPRQAMNADKDSSYRVLGITYDRATGRPIDVPKNRRPVKAQQAPPAPQLPPKPAPTKTTPRAASASNSQDLRSGRTPNKPSSTTSEKQKYKSTGRKDLKQSKRMADALKNLKVRKYKK